MKCKNCQSELEEGSSLCPNCGFDNSTESEQEPVPAAAEQPAEERSDAEQEAPAAEEAAAPEAESQPEKPAESTTETTPGLTPGKIVLLVVLGIAAVAVVVALIAGGLRGTKNNETASSAPAGQPTQPVETTEATIPADGNPNDVTCKGTYTVTDEEFTDSADTVVATMGDKQLTNAQLQIYYWMQFYDFMDMYGNYASALGMNPLQGLDTQISLDGTHTWQQFLLSGALENWRNYQAMAIKAQQAGHVVDEEYQTFLKELPDNLLENAKSYGYETADQMIQADMGKGASLESYLNYMSIYYEGYTYYARLLEQLELTDEMIEAYYEEHAEDYEAKGLDKETKFVDVRHILLTPEGGTVDPATGKVIYTDEEWAAGEEAARKLLDEFLAGEQTEERFAQMAEQHSKDPGSMKNGGLYTDVYKGQMVKPFEDWCFDETREAGDTGIVRTDYGYHIMYFVESRFAWIQSARTDLMADKGQELLKEILEEFEMEVDYGAIELGAVDMSNPR